MGLPKLATTGLYSVEEYLALERSTQERHVYLDGAVHQMAGESDAHGIISMNVGGILHAQLRGTPCQARTKDMKVRSGPDHSNSLYLDREPSGDSGGCRPNTKLLLQGVSLS